MQAGLGSVGGWVLPAGLAAVLVGAFLPWTVSGTVERHSFATVRSARLLEVGDHPAATALLAGWYLMPAVAGLTAIALVLGRRRLAGAGALLVGISAVALATVVMRTPFSTTAGPVVALAGGLVAVAAGGVLLVGRRTA